MLADELGNLTGLPEVLSQRLPEIYRSGFCGIVNAVVSVHIPAKQGLSPAVSGEESGGVLWDWGVWSAVCQGGLARIVARSRPFPVDDRDRPLPEIYRKA